MAYKKVYDNNPYHVGNIDVNAFRKVAMKDPKFALGEIIGSALAGAYANNYNNRGINKAVDKALAEYQTPGTGEQQAALQQVQQNGIGAGLTPDMDALNNVRQNMGLGAVQPAVSVGDVPPQDPQQMAAMLAQMPGAAIVAKENEARNLGNFDANTALMKARQQMMRDGRTPYQIEMALEQLQPHFQKMQDDNYRLQAERIMAELGATDENGKRLLSDNEYKQRIVDLATQYGDIGKAAANVYGRDIVSGQDKWKASQKQAAQQQLMANRAYIAGLRGNRATGKNANVGGVSKDDLKRAHDIQTSLQKKLDDMEMAGKTPALSAYDQQMWNLADAIIQRSNADFAERNGFILHNNNESPGREVNREEWLKKGEELLVKNNGGRFDENSAKALRKLYGVDPDNNDPEEPVNKLMREKYGYYSSVGQSRRHEKGLFVERDNDQNSPYPQTDFAKSMNKKFDFASLGREASRRAKEEEENNKGGRQYAGAGYWNRHS